MFYDFDAHKPKTTDQQKTTHKQKSVTETSSQTRLPGISRYLFKKITIRQLKVIIAALLLIFSGCCGYLIYSGVQTMLAADVSWQKIPNTFKSAHTKGYFHKNELLEEYLDSLDKAAQKDSIFHLDQNKK